MIAVMLVDQLSAIHSAWPWLCLPLSKKVKTPQQLASTLECLPMQIWCQWRVGGVAEELVQSCVAGVLKFREVEVWPQVTSLLEHSPRVRNPGWCSGMILPQKTSFRLAVMIQTWNALFFLHVRDESMTSGCVA